MTTFYFNLNFVITEVIFLYCILGYVKVWRNWLTLLARHHGFRSNSNVLQLSMANDTETNNTFWQAILASFAKALLENVVREVDCNGKKCYIHQKHVQYTKRLRNSVVICPYTTLQPASEIHFFLRYRFSNSQF